MITEENKTAIIQQYLNGELSGEMLDHFQVKLDNDKLFQDEVDLQRMIVASINIAGRNDLKGRLKDFHKSVVNETSVAGEHVSSSRIQSRSRTMIYGIAATISLLVIAMLVILNIRQAPESRLFETYFTAYPNVVYKNYRGSGATANEKMNAFAAYDGQDFAQAAAAFETILEKENDGSVLFYLGNSYLSLNETDKAIKTFARYLAQDKIDFEPEAKWYLGLAYLKNGEEQKAIPLLQAVSVSKNELAGPARELLTKLKE